MNNINLETCPHCSMTTFGMHERNCPLHTDLLIETNNAVYETKKVEDENKENNNYKYENLLNDALSDAIGSAINDNDTYYENPIDGFCGKNYLPVEDYDKVISEAIKNIMDINCINIRFKEDK